MTLLEAVGAFLASGGYDTFTPGSDTALLDLRHAFEREIASKPIEWGFISSETGDFVGVTEEGMRDRWGWTVDEQAADGDRQIADVTATSVVAAAVEWVEAHDALTTGSISQPDDDLLERYSEACVELLAVVSQNRAALKP